MWPTLGLLHSKGCESQSISRHFTFAALAYLLQEANLKTESADWEKVFRPGNNPA